MPATTTTLAMGTLLLVASQGKEEEEEGLGRDGKLNGAFVMGADSALDVLKEMEETRCTLDNFELI